jgi:hypothetical protein
MAGIFIRGLMNCGAVRGVRAVSTPPNWRIGELLRDLRDTSVSVALHRRDTSCAAPLPQADASQNCSIFRRMAASGTRPRAAAWLSSRCANLGEPGIAQVTAGCDITYLRKNWLQLDTSISAAQSGSLRAARLPDQRRPRQRQIHQHRGMTLGGDR